MKCKKILYILSRCDFFVQQNAVVRMHKRKSVDMSKEVNQSHGSLNKCGCETKADVPVFRRF
jgi:hypothetical protein